MKRFRKPKLKWLRPALCTDAHQKNITCKRYVAILNEMTHSLRNKLQKRQKENQNNNNNNNSNNSKWTSKFELIVMYGASLPPSSHIEHNFADPCAMCMH